jgi:hypothetical protein
MSSKERGIRLPPMARPLRYEFYGVVYRTTSLGNGRIETAEDICTRVRDGVKRKRGRSLKFAIFIMSTSNVIHWLMPDMKALVHLFRPAVSARRASRACLTQLPYLVVFLRCEAL